MLGCHPCLAGQTGVKERLNCAHKPAADVASCGTVWRNWVTWNCSIQCWLPTRTEYEVHEPYYRKPLTDTTEWDGELNEVADNLSHNSRLSGGTLQNETQSVFDFSVDEMFNLPSWSAWTLWDKGPFALLCGIAVYFIVTWPEVQWKACVLSSQWEDNCSMFSETTFWTPNAVVSKLEEVQVKRVWTFCVPGSSEGGEHEPGDWNLVDDDGNWKDDPLKAVAGGMGDKD